MALDFDKATSKLTSANTYLSTVGASAVGFMLPVVVNNLADGLLPWDVPDELGGLGVIALAEMYGPAGYQRSVQAGAGANTGVQLAERFGVRSTVESLGGA